MAGKAYSGSLSISCCNTGCEAVMAGVKIAEANVEQHHLRSVSGSTLALTRVGPIAV